MEINKIFGLLALSSMLAINVHAQEQAKSSSKEFHKYYVRGNFGYGMGANPGADFAENDFGTARSYSAAIGYRFNDNFRTDLSIEVRDGFKNVYTTFDQDYDDDYGNVYGADYMKVTKARSVASFLNLYLDLEKIYFIKPYFLIGAGVSRNTLKSFDTDTESDFTRIYKTGKINNFAWKIGAGADYEYSDNVDIGLNYQYVDLGIVSTGRSHSLNYATGDATNLPNARHRGKLKSHEVIFGLKYKF